MEMHWCWLVCQWVGCSVGSWTHCACMWFCSERCESDYYCWCHTAVHAPAFNLNGRINIVVACSEVVQLAAPQKSIYSMIANSFSDANCSYMHTGWFIYLLYWLVWHADSERIEMDTQEASTKKRKRKLSGAVDSWPMQKILSSKQRTGRKIKRSGSTGIILSRRCFWRLYIGIL